MSNVTSKEEIITAIRKCAQKLGHTPTTPELKRAGKLNINTLRKCFGSYSAAMRAAGMKPRGWGHMNRTPIETAAKDWAEVARKLGKIPTCYEYEGHGTLGKRPFLRLFKRWTDVPQLVKEYMERAGTAGEWQDVMELIRAQEAASAAQRRARELQAGAEISGEGPLEGNTLALPGRPIYGAPLGLPFMAYAPTSELGVVFLFGALAMKLGFIVLRLPGTFPDGEAMRRIDNDRCQRLRMEFELQSRNFLRHAHDPKKCDLVVCWEHNWPECPLPVIELKTIVEQMEW